MYDWYLLILAWVDTIKPHGLIKKIEAVGCELLQLLRFPLPSSLFN